jgi:hypothetical protein
MTLTQQQLDIVKATYDRLGLEYLGFYMTTVIELASGKAGLHVGHYLIGANFYLGIARGNNSVRARFKPHYAKLMARFDWLFHAKNNVTAEQARAKVHKSSAHWKIGEGWKALLRDVLLEECSEFPEYFRKTERGYEAGDLEFNCKHKIDVDSIPVMVWNLEHLTYTQIKDLETALIEVLEPYANAETHKKRLKNG